MALFKTKTTAPLSAAEVDAATLDQLVKAGAVLTNPRLVSHSLYARNEATTTGASAELRSLGYSVDSRPAAKGSSWLLLAEREEVVDSASVEAARQLFERLASSMDGGDYNGWEASIVERPDVDVLRKRIRVARLACAIGFVALVIGLALVGSKVAHQHWLRAHGVLLHATVNGQVTGCGSDGSNAYVPLTFIASDGERIHVSLPAQGCPNLSVGSRTWIYDNRAQPTDAMLESAPDLDLAGWWEIILAIVGLTTLIVGCFRWYRAHKAYRSLVKNTQPIPMD